MTTLFMIFGAVYSLIMLAAILAPTVLYFKDRNTTTVFSQQIALIAKIDIAFLVMQILYLVQFGFIIETDTDWTSLIFVVAGFCMLYSLWKMKPGQKFASLFANPGLNKYLHIVFLVANILLTLKLIIATWFLIMTMISLVIVGALAIFLFWLIFVKMDLVGSTFDSVGSSSGGGSQGGGSSSGSGFPLEPGDNSCDAQVHENGINRKLFSKPGGGFEDEDGHPWDKTSDGRVRRC